jgi:phosphoesterase RecJ-like protein
MMTEPNVFETVIDVIRQHKRILCVSHINPDGDAYGSLLGMGWILRHLGKTPVLAMHDRTPSDFRFMPGSEQIIAPGSVANSYDLIICLDASSPDRMGAVFRPDAHAQIPLLVIDHHITNTRFGTWNWVAPDHAATCQMLVTLAQALSVPLTGPVAQCLLTGLVTDTLGFRTSGGAADEGGGNAGRHCCTHPQSSFFPGFPVVGYGAE